MNGVEDQYKKITLECNKCKTKFDLWVVASDWFSPEFADYLNENFERFCPICKALEEMKKQ